MKPVVLHPVLDHRQARLQSLAPDRPVVDARRQRLHRWACVTAAGLLLVALWLIMGVNRPFPGDEQRFIESSRAFAGLPSVELLRTYEEMSGPLPFIYWGNWGAVFGDSLASMRFATLLWGLLALWWLYDTLAILLPRPRWVAIAFALVVLNPYWWTMSIFAYTDIFGIAGLLLAFTGLSRASMWRTAVGVAIALLCRQYLVLALPAFGVMALGWWALDRKIAIRQIVALIAGCVPFGLLVLLWGGLGPDNELKRIYQQGYFTWKPQSAWLYVSLMGLYGLPAYVWLGRRLRPGLTGWLLATAMGLLGFILIVDPSPSAIAVGFETVGLLDRTMHWLSLGPVLRQIVWSIGAALGGLLLGELMRESWRELRLGHLAPQAIVLAMLLGLLVVMPLSYLHWEKYFIPVLPWAIAGVVMLRQPARPKTSTEPAPADTSMSQ